MEQPTATKKPESKKAQEGVKASHLSSNPINEISLNGHSHFEVEVYNAFFRVFNINR
ncbi:hypothetical protein [uncultured Duncaniella sp.]|uniref:hypothetical protein n=1 Tax=uncultured Duncaniella sp. TaxID=2768039 RepID=UPI0025B6E01E|nr:hypothetical protein [uncultured Duncaniella sp.]